MNQTESVAEINPPEIVNPPPPPGPPGVFGFSAQRCEACSLGATDYISDLEVWRTDEENKGINIQMTGRYAYLWCGNVARFLVFDWSGLREVIGSARKIMGISGEGSSRSLEESVVW